MGELLLSTIVVPVKDKTIGLQLKKARLEAGLSQDEAGSQLGVTWEMISRYENGRSSPLKHLRRLAEIYTKPISYFIQSDVKEETFNLEALAGKLQELGVGYTKNTKNVVKFVTEFSGRGIEEDLKSTDSLYEVSTSLTEKYSQLFAMRPGKIKQAAKINLDKNDVLLFCLGLEAKKDDIVISYDGITYEISKFDPNSLSAAIAVLVESHKGFRD